MNHVVKEEENKTKEDISKQTTTTKEQGKPETVPSSKENVNKNDKQSTVVTQSKTDVLCGRGAPINKHPGNVIFRRVVKYNKDLYNVCGKEEKYYVAESIVLALKGQEPATRFLECQENKNGDDEQAWTVITKERAVRKTIQALRERTSPRDESHVGTVNSTATKKKKRKYSNITCLGEEESERWGKIMHHLNPGSGSSLSSSSSPSSSPSSSSVYSESNDSNRKRQKTEHIDSNKLIIHIEEFQKGQQITSDKPESSNSSSSNRVKSCFSIINESDFTPYQVSTKSKYPDNESEKAATCGNMSKDAVANDDGYPVISLSGPKPSNHHMSTKEDGWSQPKIDFDDIIGQVILEEDAPCESPTVVKKSYSTIDWAQTTTFCQESTKIKSFRSPCQIHNSNTSNCAIIHHNEKWVAEDCGDDMLVAQDLIISERSTEEKMSDPSSTMSSLMEKEEATNDWSLADSPTLLEW